MTGEPPPLGGAGPNPARPLGTAVANCPAASRLFLLREFRIDAEPLRAVATVSVVRSAQNRLRIGGIGVEFHLAATATDAKSLVAIDGIGLMPHRTWPRGHLQKRNSLVAVSAGKVADTIRRWREPKLI